MKKMPCLFVRQFHGRNSFTITEEVTPGCEWALNGEGTATVKFDGTACMVKDNRLYKRYDAKFNRKTGEWRQPPEGAIECSPPDPVTGHWPHWVLVSFDNPEDKWHCSVLDKHGYVGRPDGTYELCGPAFNGNPEGFVRNFLVAHGSDSHGLEGLHWDFAEIKSFLEVEEIEGLVFHHPDGRMCKIRRHDFGLPWPVPATSPS